ncbi:MAG: transglutaminase-like domain-containing protein [Cytophagales bacterium]|nr:transglutaminase-like domain-containing protein [Cytophagales bacterium]
MTVKQKKKNLFLGLILLVLPTLIVSYPLLNYISEHYSLLFINTGRLVTVFGGAMVLAFALHSTRLRFFIVFGALLVVLYFIYQSIVFFPFDEFDSYYIASRFRINATLFVLGWFAGFGIARWRYFLIIYALLVLTISAIALSSVGVYDANQLSWLIAPPVLYVFYVLFAKELLNSIRHQSQVNYGKILLRIAVFCSILFLFFWGTTELLQNKFSELDQELQAQQNGEGEGGSNEDRQDDNMMDRNEKDQFRLKDYTELRPRLRQSEELLFTAYMDNFLDNGVPNPQYITLYHLNQYNEELERFEVDPEGLADDLFLPNPTQIPNYYVQIDEEVLENDKMEKFIKPIQSTIYINQLDPEVFVAPSTAYSCQPISVEAAFRDQYKFAYNVQSEVSALNSAYFVYNTREPELKQFQEERFNTLRKVKDYTEVSQEYLDYYTRMPSGGVYDKISELAADLTKDAKTPVDKVIALRDYFLSKDENGEPRFVYTLTPGSPTDPNIPDLSLLNNFLFNTQKGYCTYFAASTLFMLRSQGIPTRMAVGFLTVNRSHNNPGWYWFYADQAHAWTQVYFPEYGWLDFDLTISNEDAEETNQPDRTPPLPPVEPQFVAKGVITQLDTATKALTLDADLMVLKKTSMSWDEPKTFDLDVSAAKVIAEYDTLSLADLEVGDTAVVTSFDLRIQNMREKRRSESNEQFADRLPDNILVQEIMVNPEPEEEIPEEDETTIREAVNQWIGYAVALLALIVFVLLSAPFIHYSLIKSGYKSNTSAKEKTIALYPIIQFLMNQMGYGRGLMTPSVYAKATVDTLLGTRYTDLMEIYLKIKYSNENLTSEEEAFVHDFYEDFQKKFRVKFSVGSRLLNFLKVNRWFYYLINLNIT